MPHLEKGAKPCRESLLDGRLVELTEDELRGGSCGLDMVSRDVR